MIWLMWGVLLLAQNASFTWVSRARQSANPWYTARASLCSNGIWFVGQIFIIDIFMQVRETGELTKMLPAIIFYTCMTTTGTVMMQSLLLKLEKGKNRVGAYEK